MRFCYFVFADSFHLDSAVRRLGFLGGLALDAPWPLTQLPVPYPLASRKLLRVLGPRAPGVSANDPNKN